jgi:hypothetical protein
MGDFTTRATFVMHKGARDLLSGIAQRNGVSQSEIMNVAPFAYIVLAERSLRRRERWRSSGPSTP